MADTIVEAIRTGEISTGNISFSRLRGIAGRDHGRWNELGRGRAILTSTEQLDQYLYSYGPMTESQWDQFLTEIMIPTGTIRMVDYGCGQGLASALLLDKFGRDLLERVARVVLVEPSALALVRARAILECYCENAQILVVNKTIDELTPEELRSSGELNNLHLFSNVLDISSFRHFDLFKKMLQTKGRHSILAVSHNRDFDGGSARFRELERAISDPSYRDWLSVSASIISEFHCSSDQPAISWQLHLEVLRGPF